MLAASAALVVLFTYPLARDPGHLLPDHKDPLMYAWTMVSNVHRLLSVPLSVFHGNTFYPNGNSVAYTDLLLTPTLFPAGPVYLLTGNPVLQYNVTLLVWWALSGWAMYVLAHALLRSHPGAALAAVAFTLCPFRTDFYLEFQMQLAFPIPLALLCLWRFLETHRWRHALGAVALLWVEALASMYYGIILGLCLAILAGLHLLLRPGAWGRRPAFRGAVASVILAGALGPFIVPYAQNRTELGLERAMDQPRNHYADVLTYLETGPARLYHFEPSGHINETSLFMGFVALALAAAGCALRDAPGPAAAAPTPVRRALRRAMTLGVVAAAAATVAVLGWPDTLHRLGLRHPAPQRFLTLILALGLARIALEGWWAVRDGRHRGPLGDAELRWICLFLIALFFDLSLGPYVQYGRHEMGKGLYSYLYPYLLPLHAMRITSRIGVVVVLGVALLAGLGLREVLARLPGRRARLAVATLAVGALLAEYAPFPLPYQPVRWERPPRVYRAIAADPEDVAILEWPMGYEDWDDYFTFMSIHHWKRLTNGASGFLPAMSRDISTQLSQPDTLERPFPTPGALRYLQGIYPLRYVVVHNAILDASERRKWTRLRSEPGFELIGRFGEDDLYRSTGAARGGDVEKLFSWDYAHTRKEVALEARPVGAAAGRWIEVGLNGRPLGRQDLHDGWNPVVLPLAGPLRHAAPNVLTIRWRYWHPIGDSARVIGRTGVTCPEDLLVTSGGQSHGDRASILVDGVEEARNRRGYNLVAIDPAAGRVVLADAFDTFAASQESHRLAEALRTLAPGTIVAAAVKDEASAHLTEEALAALRSVGAHEDIRGRYRVSHLLIGVKGAAPGTAVERVGDDLLETRLGTPADQTAVEVRNFALR